MPTRTHLLCLSLVVALAACGQSDEERAASRAPGATSSPTAPAASGPARQPDAQSQTQTASARGMDSGSAALDDRDDGTSTQSTSPEQDRIGPTRAEVTLDPAQPARSDAAGTATATPPPAETDGVGEDEARAQCDTLTGAARDECIRNVERGFDRARQGDDAPASPPDRR